MCSTRIMTQMVVNMQLTITDGKNLSAIHHSWYPVSYCDYCTICKLSPNGFLQNQISCIVNWCSCFIQHQYLTSPQKGAPQTEQLSLSHTPVCPSFNNWITVCYLVISNWTWIDHCCKIIIAKVECVPEESKPSSFSWTASRNWHFPRTFTWKLQLGHICYAKHR